MVGFARHVCDGLGFSYPTPEEIEDQYLKKLRVPSPEGIVRHMDYDEIFDWTIGRIREVWLEVTRYALGLNGGINFRREEWDLDTGRNKLDQQAKIVFWGVA